MDDRERRTPMNVVRIELLCDQPGCSGEVVSTGNGITRGWNAEWQHECLTCRHRSVLHRTYPSIQYEAAVIAREALALERSDRGGKENG